MDDSISTLISNCKDLSAKLEKIYQTTREQREEFNIFEVISDQYRKENLHSDILQCILDPNTKGIGNIQFLHAFIDFLNEYKKLDIQKKDFDTSTSITREEGRIDILIKNEASKKAILIENKINGAGDQENQLTRYYEYVTKSGYTVVSMIYLTLLGGEPSYDYDKELTLLVPAIHETEKNLSNCFLTKCKKLAEPSELTKIFIDQYQKLLQIIGENFMAKGTREELLQQLFEEKETVMNISDIWNNKKEIIANMIINEIKVDGVSGTSIWSKDYVALFKVVHTHNGKKYESSIDIYQNYENSNCQWDIILFIRHPSDLSIDKFRDAYKNILKATKKWNGKWSEDKCIEYSLELTSFNIKENIQKIQELISIIVPTLQAEK